MIAVDMPKRVQAFGGSCYTVHQVNFVVWVVVVAPYDS